MTVWVDAWQMQCCGEQFGVGSHVPWTFADADAEWIAQVLGSGIAVDAAEEHHGGVPDGTPETTGTVTAVSAVHCRVRASGRRGSACAPSGPLFGRTHPGRVSGRLDARPRRLAFHGLPGPDHHVSTLSLALMTTVIDRSSAETWATRVLAAATYDVA